MRFSFGVKTRCSGPSEHKHPKQPEHPLIRTTDCFFNISRTRLYFGVVLRKIRQVSNRLRKIADKSTEAIDRLMTVRQVAGYLNVNERTVLKLVADGALPGVKIGNQWRFRKAMLDTWLDDQMLGVGPRYFEVAQAAHPPARILDLASCFQPSHINPDLSAQT